LIKILRHKDNDYCLAFQLKMNKSSIAFVTFF